MPSIRDGNLSDLTTEEYQEAIQTLEATQEIRRRLCSWATKLDDPKISISLYKLVYYCDTAIRQCHTYFGPNEPFPSDHLAWEQLCHGVGSLELHGKHGAEGTEDNILCLDLLLAEIKRREEEVSNMLSEKLAELEKTKKEEEIKRQRRNQEHVTALEHIPALLKVIHSNNEMGKRSSYMSERCYRKTEEVMTHLLPKWDSFAKANLKISDRAFSRVQSPDELYPGCFEVEKILGNFLSLSADCITFLQTITDPLNINLYKGITDVPYEDILGAIVGKGSYGTVYPARKKKTNAVVAIKQLKGMYSTEHQDKVRKELNMLQLCVHPNIVTLLDAYQIQDHMSTFYLVMEPWAPYTLGAFIEQSDSQRHDASSWFRRGNRVTEERILGIFEGLVDGLCYLHEKSIKHKDLKPDNILLHDEGHSRIRPIIADLGISKISKTGNLTDFNKSTYIYLAPEQVNSTGSTLRSDVWQLGCCFALLLAVFKKGSAGYEQMWTSFNDDKRACNIALEAPNFMATFGKLCGHGSVSQQRAHKLINCMLKVKPEERSDIEAVRTELADIIHGYLDI